MKKIFFIILMFLGLIGQAQNYFFFGLNNAGIENTNISTNSSLSDVTITIYNAPCIVDWGDGTSLEEFPSGISSANHDYVTVGSRNIIITSTDNIKVSRFQAQDDFSSFDVSENININYLNVNGNNLSSLNTSTLIKLDTISCTGNNLTSIDLSNNVNLLNISFFQNSNLSSININGNTSVVFVNIVECGFSSIDISTNTALLTFAATSNNLSESAVNGILVSLDNNGLSNGVVQVNNNTAPTGAGLTAKTSLQGKGWTVITD